MADYIPITDESLAVGKFVTSDKGKRLRDNPLAIAQGAANAPRVQTAALASPVLAYGTEDAGSGNAVAVDNLAAIGWVKITFATEGGGTDFIVAFRLSGVTSDRVINATSGPTGKYEVLMNLETGAWYVQGPTFAAAESGAGTGASAPYDGVIIDGNLNSFSYIITALSGRT